MNHFRTSRMRAFAGLMLAVALLITFAVIPASAVAASPVDTQLASLSQAVSALWSLLGSLKMRASGMSLAQVSWTSGCSASLISLLGDGCHQMYTDTSGSPIYCNSAMTQSAKGSDTAVTQGCTSPSGTTSGGSTSSCSSALISLLGDGCHYMYTNSSGSGIYCDGPMTKSAKSGDTATTAGCTSSGSSSFYQGSTTTTSGTSSTSWTGSGTASSGGTTTSTSTGALTATVSGSDVALNWSDFSQVEDEYQVDRKVGTGAWLNVGTSPPLTNSAGAYKDIGVANGTYDYRVRPCARASGCAGESNYARATVGGSSTSSTPNRTAIPPPVIGSITVSGLTPTTATVSWVTDIEANSRVEYAFGSSSGSAADRAFTTNHKIYLTGLVASTTYTYSVTSENYDYYRTSFSNQKFTTLSAAASTPLVVAPVNLSAQLEAGGNNVLLTWTDNFSAERYQVDRRNSGGVWIQIDAMPASSTVGRYHDGSLTPGSYEYRIRACTVDACSQESNTTAITVTASVSSSCSPALTSLLGAGCHYMYNDSAGTAVYCDGPMTKSVRSGDTATTAGCTSSGWPVASCPVGFHTMASLGGVGFGTGSGYCMSDVNSTICQSLGGGASYICPTGTMGTTTPTVSPALATLSPASGPIGTRVIISGSGFTPTGNRISFDSGVIMDVTSTDGKNLSFVVPDDRVPLCAMTEPRCLLPAPYNLVKPGTYWVSVTNANGVSGGIQFSVIESVVGTFVLDPGGTFPKPGAGGVETSARVRVKFTREIDSASMTKEFFRFAKTGAPDARVPGSFSVFSDGFEFVPSAELEPTTSYTYTVLASLRDRSGSSLVSSYNATFTTAASTRGSGTISGTVVDAKGVPVAKSHVYVFVPQTVQNASYTDQNYFSRNADTDANGTFQLTVRPGFYIIEVYPPDGRTDTLRTAPQKVIVAAGETQTVNFTLGGTTKIITGTVSFADGVLVADAEVAAYASETRQWTSTATDAVGAYILKVGPGQWFAGVYPKEASATWRWRGKPQSATFARDSKEEIITRNFIVTASDATLVVSALDETGVPLENIGIIADTQSGSSVSIGDAGASPEFRITGSDGKAKFTLGARTYYLRGYARQQRGYTNPVELEVRLGGGETKEMKFTFKKKQAVAALTISGATKIEEGIAVDAFVWAWSERGGFVSTRADANGAFSVSVAANERWHVSAGKEYKDFPYKSPEIVVNVKTSSVTVELLLTKQTLAPLPPTVSVSESGAQQVVAQVADGAKLTLPPGAAASAGDVKLEINPTVDAPTQAGTDVVSTVYDVTVHDAAGNSITALSKEAEIVIPYNEAELKKQGVSEDALVPSYFDEKTGTWVKLDACTIDKERNVAVCRVDHLTRFAITARADTAPPDAPSAVAASPAGLGVIKITWKNPAKDFDYAKVYRSLKAGELGTVRAATVRSAAFADNQGLADSATYYYTVRAVDPAGNESVNIAQVSAVAKGSSGTSLAKSAVGASAPGGLARTLQLGTRGNDVALLQQILVQEGLLAEDGATGYFGKLTRVAVIAFQEKYADEVLAPAGLTKGSGVVGAGTRKKLNTLIK